jgi:hypothetical protein
MPQPSLIRVRGTLYLFDLTIGWKKVRAPSVRLDNEDDLQAHLLWLSRHGRSDEAELLLEAYCQRCRTAGPAPP